jgi:AraC-like DNA-binding protein
MAIPGVIVTIMNRGVILEDMRLAGVFSFCFTLIYAILGIYGIKQVSMKKYKTDYLDKDVEKFELIKNRLVDYVVEDKAFLNPQLNIVDVARNINSNRTYISNIVNKEFGMNFNNFVNHYRVEHAKKLIGEDENNSHCIEYIYENSGFGSEISFIRAFKKFEKENPSAYRKSLNSDK